MTGNSAIDFMQGMRSAWSQLRRREAKLETCHPERSAITQQCYSLTVNGQPARGRCATCVCTEIIWKVRIILRSWLLCSAFSGTFRSSGTFIVLVQVVRLCASHPDGPWLDPPPTAPPGPQSEEQLAALATSLDPQGRGHICVLPFCRAFYAKQGPIAADSIMQQLYTRPGPGRRLCVGWTGGGKGFFLCVVARKRTGFRGFNL